MIHSSKKAPSIASSLSEVKKPLFKPIICGEYHRTPNASLVLLENADALKKKGFDIVAYECNITTEAFHGDKNQRKIFFELLKQYFKKNKISTNFRTHIELTDEVCCKLLLILRHQDIKDIFKETLNGIKEKNFHYLEDYPPVLKDNNIKIIFLKIIEKTKKEELNSYIKAQIDLIKNAMKAYFMEDMKKLFQPVLEVFQDNPFSIEPLLEKEDILEFYPAIILERKGIKYEMIDQKREEIFAFTGDVEELSDNNMILRDRAMLKEIYHLAKKGGAENTPTNIIAVMGLSHVMGLAKDYPDAAVYRNVSEVSDFKNCLKDAFKPREEDFKLPAPTKDFEKLYDLLQSQKLNENNHDRHP